MEEVIATQDVLDKEGLLQLNDLYITIQGEDSAPQRGNSALITHGTMDNTLSGHLTQLGHHVHSFRFESVSI
jgi:hypothetical protein